MSIFPALPKLEYDSRFNTPQSYVAGKTLAIQVDFSGVPTPSALWKLNGTELGPTQRTSIETNEYNTTLTIRGLRLEDAGSFRVEVKNSAGTATASFDISIKGENSSLIKL